MKTIEQAFAFFDQEQKGYLNTHQAKCALLYLHGELPAAFKDITRRRAGEIDLRTLDDLSGLLTPKTDAELVSEVFSAMDQSSQGFLTRQDFDQVCERYAKFLSPTARRDLFAELDSNTDGRVTLRDLARCLSYAL